MKRDNRLIQQITDSVRNCYEYEDAERTVWRGLSWGGKGLREGTVT